MREYFEKTPKMPTYLIAVVISELDCRENEAKNFSVCYRPSAYDQSGYSFEMGQRIQQAYDVLFDYKFSTHMPKLTIAAIPQLDPGIGGMENWGKCKIKVFIRCKLRLCINAQCILNHSILYRFSYVSRIYTTYRSKILDEIQTTTSCHAFRS